MEDVELQIFVPNEKRSWLTPNIILYAGLFASISICWFIQANFGERNFWYPLMQGLAILLGVAIIGFIFFSNFIYERLNGVLKGEIIFKKDKVAINDRIFELSEMSNLDFNLSDYYGRARHSIRADLNPKLSSGVNNYITFTDASGETNLIYFKLATQLHYQDLAPFINEAIKLKKMTFKQAIDIVGIENVAIS